MAIERSEIETTPPAVRIEQARISICKNERFQSGTGARLNRRQIGPSAPATLNLPKF